jgi:DNA polymerase-4
MVWVLIKQEDIPSNLYSLKLRDILGIGASTYNRITNAGISTVKDLCNLDIVELRRVWGSSLGERCWYGLRGIELADSLTKNQSIGNSQVLAPKLRSQSKAKEVAYRLLQKATSRMRKQEGQATRQILAIELESGEVYKHAIKFSHCADSFNLLSMLTKSWDALMGRLRFPKIKKISITLAGLIKNTNIQPKLFVQTQGRNDTTRLLTTIDLLNKKFGRDAVSIGVLPDANKDVATTKIAFSRIPNMEEFFK